jgi:hypothetical protein
MLQYVQSPFAAGKQNKGRRTILLSHDPYFSNREYNLKRKWIKMCACQISGSQGGEYEV